MLNIDDDIRMEDTVKKAVDEADRIIMEASNGTVEETNYLTTRVALRFAEKSNIATQSAMLRQRILEEHGSVR